MFAETRANAIKFTYANVLKPMYFMLDPEYVHNSFVKTGAFLGSNRITKSLTSLMFNYQNEKLCQNLLGINFRNPIGLAAGFDKNGAMASIMEDVGFGFAELGSITAKPCSGNTGLRLKRFPEKQSLWVNFGLNNKGAVEIHKNLKGKEFKIPIGISAAKTNCKETVDPKVGLKDYLFTVKEFRDTADFFDLNISCPNAYGGRDFADPKLFEELAKEVHNLKLRQPVFVKMSPDLTQKNIDSILEISADYGISGFICTNLTKKHKLKSGGLSGKSVKPLADKVLSYVYKKSKSIGSNFLIVGVGGIFSAEDAYAKITHGANLAQLVTGMVYQGPELIGQINLGLVKLLEKDGYSNISEAVGASAE